MSELRMRLEEAASRGDVVLFTHHGRPCVVLSHPRYFKRVLVDAAARYMKVQKERPFFGNGLLMTEGQEWTQQRRDATRLFLDDAATHRAVLADALADLIAGWRQPGPHDVVPAVERFILRNLSASLFGTDLGESSAALSDAIQTLIRVHPREPSSMQTIAGLRELVSRQPGLPPLFQNPDQITTFLLAGTETAANTLTWAMHLLARTPAAAELVRQEGDAAATAVVQETLRLYPPLWIMTREVRERDVIDGVELDVGTLVYLFVLRVHRDPRFWREPAEFRPERFRAGEQEPFAFIPFGAGARVCVGRRFAMAEITAAVREAARLFDLAIPTGEPSPEEAAYFTLRAAGPVRIVFGPRAAAPAGPANGNATMSAAAPHDD